MLTREKNMLHHCTGLQPQQHPQGKFRGGEGVGGGTEIP